MARRAIPPITAPIMIPTEEGQHLYFVSSIGFRNMSLAYNPFPGKQANSEPTL